MSIMNTVVIICNGKNCGFVDDAPFINTQTRDDVINGWYEEDGWVRTKDNNHLCSDCVQEQKNQ